MPYVAQGDREALDRFLERKDRPTRRDPEFVHESVWAEFLRDRMSWELIREAPRDGTPIEVLYDDGTSEVGVYWSETRQCVLGPRAGERGPGWLSPKADHLPVGDEDHAITHYRRLAPVRP